MIQAEGQAVGIVTSGCPSPTLGYNITMAYVLRALSKICSKLQLKVCKRTVPAEIVKMLYVPIL